MSKRTASGPWPMRSLRAEPTRTMGITMTMFPFFSKRRALSLCLAAVLSGCATTASGGHNPFDPNSIPGASTAEDPIQIDVQNSNFNDVTIWAIRSGQRVRLGRVTGKTDQRFRIAWNPAIPIYFTVDEVGGRGCRTNSLSVERNARVWIMIPANIGLQPCQAGRR